MNKTQLKNRLVIGSANFTQKYGVSLAKISPIEIKKILDLAKKKSIYKIDTADAYLKNKNIFKDINKKFKFSTKITPDHNWTSLEFCQKKLEDHFKIFGASKIQNLLFHDVKILFTKNGLKIFT